MKLADRKDHSNSPSVHACIAAREREVEELSECKRIANLSLVDLRTFIQKIEGESPTVDLDLLRLCDRELTFLRSRIRAIRTIRRKINARDTREENGVLRP